MMQERFARGQIRWGLSGHGKDFRFNSKFDGNTVEDGKQRSERIKFPFYKDHSGYHVHRLQGVIVEAETY